MGSQFPDTYPFKALNQQIIRSATSVGANYRSACRSKSRRDFINKLKIVEEELDETIYWLELISESGFLRKHKFDPLKKECTEILSIIVRSVMTARKNQKMTTSEK
jgi:four helix bundle protein